MQSALMRPKPVSGAPETVPDDGQAQSTVIIVDDDPDFCSLLRCKLETKGYRVETCHSAQEYLDLQKIDGPCCILLDIQMPGMSGLELQERLIREEFAPPVVFVTGVEDIKTCLSVMKKGAQDYLIKPFEEKGLLEAVRDALAKCVKSRRSFALRKRAEHLLGTLTPRERQVLDLVIKGKLNKEVAAELGLAEITVKVHRSCLLRKLDAHSVAELVRLVTCAESRGA